MGERIMKYWKELAAVVLLLVTDQLTKVWALQVLKPGPAIPLIKQVLELFYIENRGAAFGILQNKQYVFLFIAAAIVTAIIILYPRIPDEKKYIWLRICMIGIVSGAIGNVIDRIYRGYVVDFIFFKLIDFPVFNVADIYVTGAAILLICSMLFIYKDEDIDRILGKRK